MKFLRLLAKFLFLVIALAALLAVVSIAPILQTRVAKFALAKRPGLHGSIGALSARFGDLQIADLHLERDGAIITIPYLEAHLPLTAALWTRKIAARSLVAKGWTLDLSHGPGPAEAPTPASGVAGPERAEGSGVPAPAVAPPAQALLQVIHGILSGGKFPCDVSLDGVDLEGDVLVPSPPGNPPTKIHVAVKGDGVAAGRDSALVIDAAGEFPDTTFGSIYLTAHGHLVVAMDSPRTLNRIELKAELWSDGRSLPKDLVWSVDVAAARSTGEETYTLDLGRDSRRLASILVHVPAATGRLMGTWKIDLRDSDLALFLANRPLPSVAASGEGDFDTDAALTRVHALGRLNLVTSRWSALAPSLDFLGAVTLDTRFDLAHSGQFLRVDRLSVSVAGPGRAAVVQSLQPFDLDERTGHPTLTDPRNDWLEVSIGEFPLTGLPDLPGGFNFTGGKAKGDFVARTANGGYALRSKTPVTASDVAVQRAGKVVGRGLDLSLSLLADYTSSGWQVECKPLTVGSAGQRLATFETKATCPAKADQPTVIAGTWNADLKALAAQSAIPGTGWITARSASGDFSASVGTWTSLEGKLTVVGPAADQTISTTYQAGIGADLAVAFHAPIKITVGSSASEISADGTWTSEKAGDRIEARLAGANVALEHLQLLVAPLAAIGGSSLAAVTSPGAGGRDRVPFWGDWVGSVTLGFDRLRAGDQDLNGVRGRLEIDHGSVRLKDGMWELANHSLAQAEGSVSFEPAAALPYGLKVTATLGEVDATPLFGEPTSGPDPVFKGRFSVATTLTGSGINFDDLVGRIDREYRLTSKNGIVRLLKTSVAETIPEPSAPVSDALDTAGSVVGTIFGRPRGTTRARENHVSKNTEAVLDFTILISEIGYDQMTIVANQGSDHTIHLREIAMTGREVNATGTGQIGFTQGRALFAEPLSVELQLGVRGKLVELLTTAGLLSSRKDEKGYTLLNQSVHFGGTLQHLDLTQWHDLLAKAATPKPDEKKKEGTPPAVKK